MLQGPKLIPILDINPILFTLLISLCLEFIRFINKPWRFFCWSYGFNTSPDRIPQRREMFRHFRCYESTIFQGRWGNRVLRTVGVLGRFDIVREPSAIVCNVYLIWYNMWAWKQQYVRVLGSGIVSPWISLLFSNNDLSFM